ncbi:MAG: thioether cross-link-forming SCIFF peptide maturase [Oscillospiraceae bacterium]|nr:thioether cross-link-forming SCIFF peptide maturase [Oscillospiraceae bacterium]
MIHAYELHGRYIVLDVESGAVHELDRAAFDVLQLVGQQNPSPAATAAIGCSVTLPEQAEAWKELQTLQAEGLLFTEPEQEQPSGRTADLPLKALCMHVSHDCNLRCAYCFAQTGDFGTGSRSVMAPEIAERAVDYLLERCGGRKNLEIDFFGGEPLLALDTVKHTVAYAKKKAPEKHFRFTLTTNGLLLDEETIGYLNAEMDNLVLSLDGRREVNDRHRGQSYDSLIPKYKRVIETRTGDYYVRGTYTKQNLDFAEDIKHLASLGFANISLEPAVLPPGHPLALSEGDLPKLTAEYEKLCKFMEEDGSFSFFHFNVDLSQGPCVYKRLRGCGAGVEYAAVTPEGDVYPCHQFVGREKYRMGSVLDGQFSKDVSSLFKALDANSREECQNCRIKYFCGGGCAAANLTVNGDMMKADRLGCALGKKRLDCAIYLKTAEMAE